MSYSLRCPTSKPTSRSRIPHTWPTRGSREEALACGSGRSWGHPLKPTSAHRQDATTSHRAAPHQYTKKLSTLIHALPFSLSQPRKTPSLLGSSSSSLDLPPSSSQLYADDRRRDLPDTTLLASPHRPLAHINNTLPIPSPPDRFNVAGRQRSGLHIQRFV
jgi:hypothetical protein